MLKIRRNVFETDSSSMHTVALRVGDGKQPLDIEYNKDGYIIIDDCDDVFFNDSFDILSSQYEKMCYAIASLCNKYKDLNRIIVKALRNIDPYIKGIVFPWFDTKHIKKDEYGYEELPWDIDHQSMDVLKDYLKYNNKTIEEFILDDDIVVFIDHDGSTVNGYVAYAHKYRL